MATQIGGKYDGDNPTFFHLKKLLTDDGIRVVHPIGWSLFKLPNGRIVAYDPSQTKQSFSQIERDYYANIEKNKFHWLANSQTRFPGRVGVSASLELCWAMLNRRTIFATNHLLISNDVSPSIGKIVERNADKILVVDIQKQDPGYLIDLAEANLAPVEYQLDATESNLIRDRVTSFLETLAQQERSADS